MKKKKYFRDILKTKKVFVLTQQFFSCLTSEVKHFIKHFTSKEVTVFSQTNYSFSFKPFLLAQGVVVFAVVLFSLFAIGNLFIPKPQISETQIIKDLTIKQTSAIVANSQPSFAKGFGGARPVKWTVIVKRSQINENQNLVQLPKTAKNIKVKTISKKDAETILAKTIPPSQ